MCNNTLTYVDTGAAAGMSANDTPLLVIASSAIVGGSIIVAMVLAIIVVVLFVKCRRRGKPIV